MDEELERKNKKLEDDPYDYNLKDALYTEESKVRPPTPAISVFDGTRCHLTFAHTKCQRRMISNELTVEDIVRQRSLQVFRSKCRIFDVPQDVEDFLNKRR